MYISAHSRLGGRPLVMRCALEEADASTTSLDVANDISLSRFKQSLLSILHERNLAETCCKSLSGRLREASEARANQQTWQQRRCERGSTRQCVNRKRWSGASLRIAEHPRMSARGTCWR